MKNKPLTQEFEQCVMCGELTNVLVSTPVEQREFYEEGCGQLCVDCYKKIYNKNGEVDTFSDEQIRLAIKRSRKNKYDIG